MKALLTACILLLSACISSSLHAQELKEGRIRFAKADRPCLLVTYIFSRGIVENALRNRLARAGFPRAKSEKGFDSYQGVSWPEVSTGQVDVYTRVDGKGSQSTVVLLVSKGYDNYVSSASDAAMTARMKAFLNSLMPDIQAEQLRADITAQEETIRQAERAYKAADEDGNRLARDRERIDKQIADNAAIKATRAESLNAEKGKLEALKALIK